MHALPHASAAFRSRLPPERNALHRSKVGHVQSYPRVTIPLPLFVIIAHSWRRRRQRNVAQTPPSRRRMRIGALYLGSPLTAAALFSCAQEKSSETSGGCEKARVKLQAETCERAVAKVPRDCSCADVNGQKARRSRTQPQNQRRILDV